MLFLSLSLLTLSLSTLVLVLQMLSLSSSPCLSSLSLFVVVAVVVVVAVAIVMVVVMFVGLFTEARSSHSPAFQKTVRPTESQNRWKSSEQKEQCVFKIEEKMSPGKRNLNKSFYFQKPQRINLNEMRKSSNDNVGLAFFNLHFLVLL